MLLLNGRVVLWNHARPETLKNVFLRRNQFRLAETEYFARTIARRLVSGKIRNQRTLLQRNHIEPNRQALSGMKDMADRAEESGGVAGGVVGIGGKCGSDVLRRVCGDDEAGRGGGARILCLSRWMGANRRPPRDPVNAMLSLGYSLLAKDLTVACYAVGFDPYVGFYHQPRFGAAGPGAGSNGAFPAR